VTEPDEPRVNRWLLEIIAEAEVIKADDIANQPTEPNEGDE
jgi:hypothetical protein